VRLHDVFHRRVSLRALAAAVDVGDDRHARAGCNRLLEPFDAIEDRGHLGLVDDRDRAGVTRQTRAHQLPGLSSALDVSLAMWETTLPSLDAFAMSGREDGDPGLVRLDDAPPMACESYGVTRPRRPSVR